MSVLVPSAVLFRKNGGMERNIFLNDEDQEKSWANVNFHSLFWRAETDIKSWNCIM